MTGRTVKPTCDAAWIGDGRGHISGERCGRRAPLVLAAGGQTLRLCKYHRRLLILRLAEKGVPVRVSEPRADKEGNLVAD